MVNALLAAFRRPKLKRKASGKPEKKKGKGEVAADMMGFPKSSVSEGRSSLGKAVDTARRWVRNGVYSALALTALGGTAVVVDALRDKSPSPDNGQPMEKKSTTKVPATRTYTDQGGRKTTLKMEHVPTVVIPRGKQNVPGSPDSVTNNGVNDQATFDSLGKGEQQEEAAQKAAYAYAAKYPGATVQRMVNEGGVTFVVSAKSGTFVKGGK